jgi:hypothetical protein
MRKTIKILILLLFAAAFFAGCSKMDNNPLAADPVDGTGDGGNPDPVIKTPVQMKIDQITIDGFPEKKSNGDPWDYNPIFPIESRPDVFVDLRVNGGSSSFFRSKTEQDAYYLSSYSFTKSGSLNKPGLPYNGSVTTTYKLQVWDDDVIADDLMATFTFTPGDHYNNDNADSFEITGDNSGVHIHIYGTWIY